MGARLRRHGTCKLTARLLHPINNYRRRLDHRSQKHGTNLGHTGSSRKISAKNMQRTQWRLPQNQRHKLNTKAEHAE